MSSTHYPRHTLALSALVVAALAATAVTQQPNATNQSVPAVRSVGPGVGATLKPSVPLEFANEDGQLDRDVRQIIGAYTSAKDDVARSDVRQKLADALSKQFDARQKRREQEIADLETRVQKLRDTLRKRNDAKPQIVNSRLDQLLRDAEGLGWGDGEPRSTSAANSFFRYPGKSPAGEVPVAPRTIADPRAR